MGARVASSAADAARGADIIISAVTAASSLEAAKSVAPHLTGNPYFLDINSVSPGRKKETEKLLGAKARYVDVAILAPIHPARHQTPLLLAGPHAETVMPLLIDELEMRGAIAGDEVGQAAGLKMIRSVMIKGIEALTLECFLAAKRAGIVDEVAASLKNNYPTLDWNKVIEYNIERMASHGVRRADEMDQVAETLRELGIDPLMASATSTRQREMGQIGKEPAVRKTLKEGRAAMLDAISSAALPSCRPWRTAGSLPIRPSRAGGSRWRWPSAVRCRARAMFPRPGPFRRRGERRGSPCARCCIR